MAMFNSFLYLYPEANHHFPVKALEIVDLSIKNGDVP